MTLFLTGSPTRYGQNHFTAENGFLGRLLGELPDSPRVLLVSAAPDDVAFTDSVMEGMSTCIRNSGIEASEITMLDRRNAASAPELVSRAQWIVLCGGHVPTQNRFIHEIGLRELLKDFDGVVMGCSAGSMNCADMVYSHPELKGEAIDPSYKRWLRGLGLTDINLVPHYHQVKDASVDGLRLLEDIAAGDSHRHKFYTFPDGGYIMVKDGRSTLFGEAWEISDGNMHKISEENKTYSFMNLIFISPHFPESYWHFWLEQDARLRTDFNVTTGLKTDRIASIKNKSEMKKYYQEGGIPTARQIKGSEGITKVKAFVKKTGYPVIAKPDNGVGASGTTKICSDDELDTWFAGHSENYHLFVIEEFITGLLVSYDAIFNDKGEPVFENNSVFPTPVMDIVHDNLDTCYWCNKTVPAKLAAIGRRTVKAFGITSRFVHLEFFQLDRDREGLGSKGDYVGLEVNMRPPGGFTPDMMNFAHSTDVFQIWADMVAFGERRKGMGEQFYCAYVGRRDVHTYKHSHMEVLQKYGSALTLCTRMSPALADDLGDQVYIVRLATRPEIDAFFKYMTE